MDSTERILSGTCAVGFGLIGFACAFAAILNISEDLTKGAVYLAPAITFFIPVGALMFGVTFVFTHMCFRGKA